MGERALFIYWKVAETDAPAAQAQAAAWLAALQSAHPGLVAQLYRRAPGRPGQATVMETYAQPGAGIDDALADRITREGAQALGRWAADGRHVEVFEALPS